MILTGSVYLLSAFGKLPHLIILSEFVADNDVTPTQSLLPYHSLGHTEKQKCCP